MTMSTKTEIIKPVDENSSGMSRRSFFKGATVVGAGSAIGLAGLIRGTPAFGQDTDTANQTDETSQLGLKSGDRAIVVAAEIAEALAVTTYSHIIETAPFFGRLPSDDQGYLVAAREEEMSHYLLEKSATDETTPFTRFFYPKDMFADAQTTLNILVTLEDAFIAAYLVGVRNFSTSDLRVTAARIMGIESDHRTLARVLGADVAVRDGGPIREITGAQGVKENVDPPNNNGYERTLCWTNISQAVNALLPFVNETSARAAGFDVEKSYPFDPFTPTLPFKLGDFISFKGC
jgi:hypothetical protein